MRVRVTVVAAICLSLLALTACKSEEKTEDEASAEKAKQEETADEKKEGAAKADEKKADLTEEADLPEPTTVEGGECDKPKKLTGLEQHTVLSAKGGGCFLIDETLRLKGDDKKLAIEPGVTLKFAENAGLVVRKAAIEAKGTADKPIVLTGQRETPGFWKGIVVRESDRPGNVLEHVEITYAGSDSTFDGVEPAALMFDDYHGKSAFAIRNSTISHAEGHGLYVEANTDLEFANNTLTDNQAGAARVAPAAIGELDAETTYAGNDHDRVTVGGGTVKDHEATWPGIDVPYEVLDTIRVRKDSFITIEPGATFTFAENKGMVFRRSRLKAVGKKDAPIRWTGTREVEGFWGGIVLRQTDSIDNKLEFVEVSYAGADDTFDGVQPAAVMFDDYHGKSSFAVHKSTFSHSAGYGLYIEEKTDLDFAQNTMTKNKKGAMRIHPAVVGMLDAESTYSGNAEDRVHVIGATVEEREATWPAIDVPYEVEETVRFRKGSFLTLAPGTTIEFAEKQGMVFRRSKFKAEGTADEPILLTGVREAPGFWGGVVFRQTDSIDNILKHVTVEYAGASNAFDGVEPAGLMFDNYHGPISFEVADVTVRHSGGAGLHLEKKVALESEDCGSVALDADPAVSEKSQPFEQVCTAP